MNMESVNDNACLERVHALSIDALSERPITVLPDVSTLAFCRCRLLESIPDHGMYNPNTDPEIVLQSACKNHIYDRLVEFLPPFCAFSIVP